MQHEWQASNMQADVQRRQDRVPVFVLHGTVAAAAGLPQQQSQPLVANEPVPYCRHSVALVTKRDKFKPNASCLQQSLKGSEAPHAQHFPVSPGNPDLWCQITFNSAKRRSLWRLLLPWGLKASCNTQQPCWAKQHRGARWPKAYDSMVRLCMLAGCSSYPRCTLGLR